jgi:hypothetical protein
VLRVASEAMLEESRAPVLATWFEVLAGARRGDPGVRGGRGADRARLARLAAHGAVAEPDPTARRASSSPG